MFQIHDLAFILLAFWLRLEDFSGGDILFNLGFLRGFAVRGREFVVVGGDGRGFAVFGFVGAGLGFGFGGFRRGGLRGGGAGGIESLLDGLVLATFGFEGKLSVKWLWGRRGLT